MNITSLESVLFWSSISKWPDTAVEWRNIILWHTPWITWTICCHTNEQNCFWTIVAWKIKFLDRLGHWTICEARELLYEPQVCCYDCSPENLPAILLIIIHLAQLFWSIKSRDLMRKNAMHSTMVFDSLYISRVCSNVESLHSRLSHDTSSQPTWTPFGPTDGSVLFPIRILLQISTRHN